MLFLLLLLSPEWRQVDCKRVRASLLLINALLLVFDLANIVDEFFLFCFVLFVVLLFFSATKVFKGKDFSLAIAISALELGLNRREVALRAQ